MNSFPGNSEVAIWCGICNSRPSCGMLEVDDPIGEISVCYECVSAMAKDQDIPGFTGLFDDVYDHLSLPVDNPE